MKKCSCSECKNRLCATKVPIFENLEYEELLEISGKIDYREFDKEEVIFSEGAPADTMYFINGGKIKIYKYNKAGKEQILNVLADGEFFGELDLIKTSKYNFYAAAMEKTRICTLTKKEMKNIILRNPEIAVKLLENIGKRLYSLENLVQSLSTNDVDARIAFLLIEFMEKSSNVTDEGIEIKLTMKREDMANYIGVTRETISRKLKKFQDEGIIKIKKAKTIVILDEDRLYEKYNE